MSPAGPLGAPRVRVSCVDVPAELLADGVGLTLTLRGRGPGGTPSMLHTCVLQARYCELLATHTERSLAFSWVKPVCNPRRGLPQSSPGRLAEQAGRRLSNDTDGIICSHVFSQSDSAGPADLLLFDPTAWPVLSPDFCRLTWMRTRPQSVSPLLSLVSSHRATL